MSFWKKLHYKSYNTKVLPEVLSRFLPKMGNLQFESPYSYMSDDNLEFKIGQTKLNTIQMIVL